MNAYISKDGRYRYSLGRTWTDAIAKRTLIFCMLNPSTADAETDDPTIRRCIDFAKRQDYTALTVVNLYAYRETEPKKLWQAKARGIDIIGPDNDACIFENVQASQRTVVCAWGANAESTRERAMLKLLKDAGAEIFCLGRTNAGNPRHPLYLKKTAPFVPFP